MLVVFPPNFVAHTKIIFGYNFRGFFNTEFQLSLEFAKMLNTIYAKNLFCFTLQLISF